VARGVSEIVAAATGNVASVSVHASDVLEAVESAYRQHFEVSAARASVSFVGVDPIEVLRYDETSEDAGMLQTFATLGMSRYPMSGANESVIDAATAPRAELLLTIRAGQSDAWRSLAVLAAAPAVEGAVHAAGNRIDLGEPWVPGSRCTGALLLVGPLAPVVVSGMADVHVLRVAPATATELAWARIHGSEALSQRWKDAATDLADLSRDAVSLE